MYLQERINQTHLVSHTRILIRPVSNKHTMLNLPDFQLMQSDFFPNVFI